MNDFKLTINLKKRERSDSIDNIFDKEEDDHTVYNKKIRSNSFSDRTFKKSSLFKFDCKLKEIDSNRIFDQSSELDNCLKSLPIPEVPMNQQHKFSSTSTNHSTCTNYSTTTNYSSSQNLINEKQVEIMKPYEELNLNQPITIDKLNLDNQLLNSIDSMNIDKQFKTLHQSILTTLRLKQKDDIIIKTSLIDKDLLYLINAYERIDINSKNVQIIILAQTIDSVFRITKLATELFKNTGIKIRSTTNNDINIRDIVYDHILISTTKAFPNIKFSRNYLNSINSVVIFDEIDIMLSFKDGENHLKEIIKTIGYYKYQAIFFQTNLSDFILGFIKRCSKSDKICYVDFIDKEIYLNNFINFRINYNENNKFDILNKLLKTIKKKSKVLIYLIGQQQAVDLFVKLEKQYKNTLLITGEIAYQNRIELLDRFNNDEFYLDQPKFLISNYPFITNQKIDNIELIINYTLPFAPNVSSEFTHKIKFFKFDNRPHFVVNFYNERFSYQEDKKLQRLENQCGIKMIELRMTD